MRKAVESQLGLAKHEHASNAPQLQCALNNMANLKEAVAGTTALQIDPELLTKSETAHLLCCSKRTLDNMMRERRISYIKLTSKMVRFPRREILEYIRDHLTVHAQTK
jgi:excisionase family DNA binding protein